LPTNLQKFTQKNLNKVKIFQKVPGDVTSTCLVYRQVSRVLLSDTAARDTELTVDVAW